MAGRTRFEVVIGTDGSASGRAAVDAAAHFPWPARAGAVLVVASRGVLEWSPAARSLDEVAIERERAFAESARKLETLRAARLAKAYSKTSGRRRGTLE